MPVEITQRNYCLYFRIDRPEARNAVDFEIIDELENTVDRIYSDESVRALVITGTGDYFISGGDLRKFHRIKEAEPARLLAERVQLILERLEKAPCWSVALVNGSAYGGGWEIMLACDFALLSDRSVIGFTQGKFYLPPGWGGLTRLVERVGRSKALSLLAEASTIDAKTAIDCGIGTSLINGDNFHEQTDQWLDKITRNDRMFIHNLKLVSLAANNSKRRESLWRELEPFSHFWAHSKHEERVDNFLEKQKKKDKGK